MAVSRERTRARTQIRVDPRGEGWREHLGFLQNLGIAAVVTDPSGLIEAWNGHAERLPGHISFAGPLWVTGERSSLFAHESDVCEMLKIVGESGVWQGEVALMGSGPHPPASADVRATIVTAPDDGSVGVLIAFLQVLDRSGDDTDGRWRPVVDSLATRLALVDDKGMLVAVNEAWRQASMQSGSASPDLVGSNFLDSYELAPDLQARQVATALRRVARGELDIFETEYAVVADDDVRWDLLRASPYLGSDGWIVVSLRDVTEDRLDRERAHRHAAILDHIDAAVHVTTLDRTVTGWNAAAEELYGWSAEEAIGRRTDELMLAAVPPVPERIQSTISHGRWSGELTLGRKDGSTFPAYVRTAVFEDLSGNPSGIACVVVDFSEKLKAKRELTTARDHLRAVTDSIGEGMFTLDREGRLTYMNPAAEETLGWTVAEALERPFQELIRARHLDACLSPSEHHAPFISAPREGVANVEDDVFLRADGTELAVAYTASPIATDEGNDGLVVVFQDITDRKAEARRVQVELEKLHWVKRIQDALADEHFVLFSQPIIDLRDNEVVQRELLIRMHDPDEDKVIGPGAFLPVAEEYGLIGDIDRWVIDQATQLAANGLAVELNVSGESIGDRRLIPYIESAIRRSGADPTLLVLEITETTILRNEQEGRRFVERMHELGCRVALDDFGTGFGGFTYLKQLPVDYLKIDIEFVRDLVTNQASRSVVDAIVNLADKFNLKTVAEGVEDADTLLLLRELGVNYAQGYHIARPAPLQEQPTGITER